MSTADDSLSVASKSFLTHPSDSTSSSGNGGSSSCETPPPAVYNAPVVAKREDIAIGRAKFVVAFVLLLALAAMATTMYMLAEEQEQSNFENQVRSTRYPCAISSTPISLTPNLLRLHLVCWLRNRGLSRRQTES